MSSNSWVNGSWIALLLMTTACTGTAEKPETDAASRTNAPVKSQAVAATDTSFANLSNTVKQEFAMATGAMKNGKYSVAERILKPMLESHGDFAAGWANLGIVYFHTDRLEEAQQAFDTALTKNGQNAVVHNYLGLISRQAGDFKKAQEHYARAILIDPRYSNAYRNLGILYDLYLGELSKALESYEQYQKLSDSEDPDVAKWIVDLKRRL